MDTYKVTLKAEERIELERIIRKGSHASQKVLNALILLNCDEGDEVRERRSGREIAAILHVSERKIDRVKRRFVEEGLEVALNKQARAPCQERKLDGQLEAHLIALSCSEPPEGFAQWSLRLLAEKMVELKYVESVSHETVRRTLKKTNSSHGRK